MSLFSLPGIIISKNGTQFSITTVVNFFKELGVQIKFISVVYPRVNRKEESINKVMLKGIKKKLDDAKGFLSKKLHKVMWSYQTTPHSTIG